MREEELSPHIIKIIGHGHETCTFDVHNISISELFLFLYVYESLEKTIKGQNLIFLRRYQTFIYYCMAIQKCI